MSLTQSMRGLLLAVNGQGEWSFLIPGDAKSIRSWLRAISRNDSVVDDRPWKCDCLKYVAAIAVLWKRWHPGCHLSQRSGQPLECQSLQRRFLLPVIALYRHRHHNCLPRNTTSSAVASLPIVRPFLAFRNLALHLQKIRYISYRRYSWFQDASRIAGYRNSNFCHYPWSLAHSNT